MSLMHVTLINYEFTSSVAILHYISSEFTLEFFLKIHYLFQKYTKDSLDISRKNENFTICFVDS